MTRRTGRQAGFVLITALVLVAAMAAAVVVVLGQAETGRAHRAASQDADQLAAYLAAFEAHAMVTLTRDSVGVDHPSDIWAASASPFALDRGTVTGRISDATGRFNVNWLANPSDTDAAAAFARLARATGMRQGLTHTLREALALNPDAGDGYRQLDPPLRPAGGALTLLRQLDDIPALSQRDRALLARYITVLPGDSLLNINTAPIPGVASFFPDGRLIATNPPFRRWTGLPPQLLNGHHWNTLFPQNACKDAKCWSRTLEGAGRHVRLQLCPARASALPVILCRVDNDRGRAQRFVLIALSDLPAASASAAVPVEAGVPRSKEIS